jgi:hypothetical protein
VQQILERLRAVADLHHRHADAGQRNQIALRFLEDGHGQNGWTG